MSEQEEVYHDLTEPEPAGGQVQRWADVAMYRAEHLVDPNDEFVPLVKPRVTLVFMTPDPLRVMASASELYRGSVVHNSADVSQRTALAWLRDMTRTKLSTPLEWIDLHFLLEGVTRAFTHQLVRQRVGASYVQESQRFAVKDNAAFETRIPPSIEGLPHDHPWRVIWDDTVARIGWAYNNLVNAGVPAEDARGLLPTNITTRVHYKTTLRGLAEHAGMRLCSQAQYEWKEVWREMLRAIISYGPDEERWQQEAIAQLFRPVCYLTGKCEFLAVTDRACRIRERVMAHHANGEPPETWQDIHPHEALLEGAARVRPI